MIPSGSAGAASGENHLDVPVAKPSARLNSDKVLVESKKLVLKHAPLKILALGTCVMKSGTFQWAASFGSVPQASQLVHLLNLLQWICLLALCRHTITSAIGCRPNFTAWLPYSTLNGL